MSVSEAPGHRVLFLINNMGGGGAERVMATLANHFHDVLGWEITILTLHEGPVRYQLSPGIVVRALRTAPLSVGPGRLLALPFFAAEVAWFLRSHPADSVISFLVRPNLTLLLTRWLGNRQPIYISERCATDAVYHGQTVGSRMMLWLIRTFYPHADRIVAISHGVKDALVRLHVPGERVRVIYNPQNLAQIHASAGSSSVTRAPEERPFRIVSVGRLDEQKDYPTLFRAFRQLRDTGFDARLVILGEGPDAAKLHELAERLGIDRLIEWHGWIPSPHAVMAGCDLFVMTSRWEGFGNVIVEAMACGLPVVSTDCQSGPREILDNGRFGVLVPVGDSTALAAAIRDLAGDPAARARFRELGVIRAREFDVAHIAAQYVDVLTGGAGALDVRPQQYS